jgi:hypothetical protein
MFGPKTSLLCNKLDLLHGYSDLEGISNQIKMQTRCKSCWFVSLVDGTGLEGFVDGMSGMLQEK